jgi:hypothetical protein
VTRRMLEHACAESALQDSGCTDLHIMAAGMWDRFHSSPARGSVTGHTRGT